MVKHEFQGPEMYQKLFTYYIGVQGLTKSLLINILRFVYFSKKVYSYALS
jgi:hypothetical protein